MPTPSISKLYKQHVALFIEHLAHASGLQEKQVHQSRVDIKNLRVLLKLLEVLSKKKPATKGLLKMMDPLFKAAGKIRTPALNIKLTKSFRSSLVTAFRKELREQEKKAGIKFKKLVDQFDQKKFKKRYKAISKEFKEVKRKNIQKEASEYLRVHLAKVRADLFDINDDSTLHEIRKKLKIIKSTGAILQELEIQHPFETELNKIKETYELIGNWHDHVMLLQDLEYFINRQGEDAEEIAKAMIIVHNLKKKTGLEKRQIARKLSGDLV